MPELKKARFITVDRCLDTLAQMEIQQSIRQAAHRKEETPEEQNLRREEQAHLRASLKETEVVLRQTKA